MENMQPFLRYFEYIEYYLLPEVAQEGCSVLWLWLPILMLSVFVVGRKVVVVRFIVCNFNKQLNFQLNHLEF